MSDHEPPRRESLVITPASETPQSVRKRVQKPARRIAGVSVQAKLAVGSAGDPLEQEADQVAAQVMRQIDGAGFARQTDDVATRSRVQSSERLVVGSDHLGHPADMESSRVQRSSCDGAQVSDAIGSAGTAPAGRIQRSVTGQIGAAGGSLDTETEQRIQRARGGGQALPADLSSGMGNAMGADFSKVRIHADEQANELNQRIQAKAFTTGSDVFFRQGEYRPTERSGQELLAHELTHVVQQGGADVQRSHTPVVGTSDVGGQISVVGNNPAGHIQRDYWEDRLVATYGPEGAEQYMNGSDEQRERMLEEATPPGDGPESFKTYVALVDKVGFKELTWQSRTARRGANLKTIEKELDAYHSLAYGDVQKRLGALGELRYAANGYLQGHEEDASRKRRLAGMREFLRLVEIETVEVTALGADVAESSSSYSLLANEGGAYEEGGAHRKLKAKLEGDSGTFFSKVLPTVLNAAAPPGGGSNELEFDVNIPVIAVPGLIIGGNMKMTFEKADDGSTYNLHTEIALTTGFHVPGFTIKGKVGGYIEVQGGDTVKLSKLLSYGLYQRFRESEVVPSGVTNAFWGGSGSDIIGYGRAETWAAEIENEIFKPLHDLRKQAESDEAEETDALEQAELNLMDRLSVFSNPDMTEVERVLAKEEALKKIERLKVMLVASKQKSKDAREDSLATYAETGGVTGALVEGNIGIANAKTEFNASTGKRMDAESIEEQKGIGTKRKKKDQSNKLMGGGWGGTKTIGKGTYNLEAASSFEAGPMTIEYGWALASITDAKRQTKTKSMTLQFSGTVKTAMRGMAGIMLQVIPALAQNVAKMFNTPPGEGEDAQVYGAAAGQAPGLANAIDQMNDPGTMEKAFSDPWGKGADTQGFEGKVGIKISGQLDLGGGGKPSGEASVSMVQTSELVPWVADSAGSTSANPFKVALAKNKKLIVWKFPGGVGELVPW
jgi:hypothetical protein